MSADCHKFRDQIADFVTGVLPEPDSRELQEHLSACAPCRDYLQALRQEDASLAEYFAGIDEDMAHRQEHALQMIECSHAKQKSNTISIWRRIMESHYSKLATAAAVFVVAVLLLMHGGRLSSPAYALSQTVEAFRSIRFLHVVHRDNARAVWDERWIENGPDGRQVRYRQNTPPHMLVIDDGQSIARFHSDAKTVTLYHDRDMQYEWIRPLGRAFANLLKEGFVLEENAVFRSRLVHKVWWPAMRSVCYVDPQTRLPLAVGGLELSYEEPPAGTFEIVVPEGYAIVDDAQHGDCYAAIEVIQPATPLMQIVNRDKVIGLHRTGPHSYAGDLDIRITCDTEIMWGLSMAKTGDVEAEEYACSIDRWDMAPPGGVATVGVTVKEVVAENAPKGTQVAIVKLYVEPRPEPMDDAQALRELGLALYDARRYEEALAIFERMEQQHQGCLSDPDRADRENRALAIIWQAHMLDLLGRRSEAVAKYVKIVDMKPEGGVSQDDYGLRFWFTPYARERITVPFTRVERRDSESQWHDVTPVPR